MSIHRFTKLIRAWTWGSHHLIVFCMTSHNDSPSRAMGFPFSGSVLGEHFFFRLMNNFFMFFSNFFYGKDNFGIIFRSVADLTIE
jgi:hypothetical protein